MSDIGPTEVVETVKTEAVETVNQVAEKTGMDQLTLNSLLERMGPMKEIVGQLFEMFFPDMDMNEPFDMAAMFGMDFDGADSVLRDVSESADAQPRTAAFMNEMRDMGDRLHEAQMKAINGDGEFTKEKIMFEIEASASRLGLSAEQTTDLLKDASGILDEKLEEFGGVENLDMEVLAKTLSNENQDWGSKIADVPEMLPRAEAENIQYGAAVNLESLDQLHLKDGDLNVNHPNANGTFDPGGTMTADQLAAQMGPEATARLMTDENDKVVGVFVSPEGNDNGIALEPSEEMNVSEWSADFKGALQRPELKAIEPIMQPIVQPEMKIQTAIPEINTSPSGPV